jgi:hypothetical protein
MTRTSPCAAHNCTGQPAAARSTPSAGPSGKHRYRNIGEKILRCSHNYIKSDVRKGVCGVAPPSPLITSVFQVYKSIVILFSCFFDQMINVIVQFCGTLNTKFPFAQVWTAMKCSPPSPTSISWMRTASACQLWAAIAPTRHPRRPAAAAVSTRALAASPRHSPHRRPRMPRVIYRKLRL